MNVKEEDAFIYHILCHMLEAGLISREAFDNDVRVLEAKNTKLAKLLSGKDE